MDAKGSSTEIPDFKLSKRESNHKHWLPQPGPNGRITFAAFIHSPLGLIAFIAVFMAGAFGWGKAQSPSYRDHKAAEKARTEALSMKSSGKDGSKAASEQFKWRGDTTNLPSFDKRQNSLNMTIGYIDGKTPAQRAKEKAEAQAKAQTEQEALAKAEAEQQAQEQAAMPQMPGMPGAATDPAALMAQMRKGASGMPPTMSAGMSPASSGWKTARRGTRLAGGTGLAKGVGRGFDSPVTKGGAKKTVDGAFFASNAGGAQSSAQYNPNSAPTPAVGAPPQISPAAAKSANALSDDLLASAAGSEAAASAGAPSGAAPRRAAAVGRAAVSRAASAQGRAIAAKQMPKTNRNFAALENKLNQTAKLAGKAGGAGPEESGSLMAGQSFDNSTGEGVVEGADSKKKMMGDLNQGRAAADREASGENVSGGAPEKASALAAAGEEESRALTDGGAWDPSLCEDGEIPDPTGKPECVANVLTAKPAADPSAGYVTASRGASMLMGGALALQFLLNVMLAAPLSPAKHKTKRFVQGSLVASALATAGIGAILMGMGNTWAGLPFAVTGPLIAAGAWFAYPAVAGMSLLSVSSVPGALMALSIPFVKRDKDDKRVKRSLAFAD